MNSEKKTLFLFPVLSHLFCIRGPADWVSTVINWWIFKNQCYFYHDARWIIYDEGVIANEYAISISQTNHTSKEKLHAYMAATNVCIVPYHVTFIFNSIYDSIINKSENQTNQGFMATKQTRKQMWKWLT